VSKWLSAAGRFLRWRDWAPGKIPVLCTVVFYIGLVDYRDSLAFTFDAALFIAFAAVHSALGYVVNNWGDRKLDALHDKPNAFADLTRAQGVAALTVLLLLALLSGLPFVRRPMVLPLWAGWALFALAYSLPPLRLKERGAWGLGVSFVAQWSLPVLLAFAALERFWGWDMIAFTVAATVSGATLEIAHQRWDRARDVGTQTGTWGARTPASGLDRLYAVALFLDKAACGAILATMTINLAPIALGTRSLSPGLPLLPLYVLLLIGAICETIRASRQGVLLDPYYSRRRSFAKLLHETMPNLIVPVYLMVLATAYQPLNGLFLLGFLLWRLVLGQADWRWPLRALRARLSR
jgi:hypothetical protein